MNTVWLEKAMASRGLTFYALRYEHHISPLTIRAWAKGQEAKPATLRRLAEALGLDYETLRKNLQVTVLTTARIRRGRYDLKAKEARGILSRANRTGRALPTGMKEALEKHASKSKK